MGMEDHLLNPELIGMALSSCAGPAFRHEPRWKAAFVPPPDAGGGAQPGGAPGGDPAAAGGMPPADPSGMGGGGGGNPGGGLDAVQFRQILTEVLGQQGAAGGAAGAAGPGLKPKIDVNVELMLIKNMLAKICDALQIPIPAQDMTATPDKLNAMAAGQQTSSSPNTAAAGQSSPIAPIQPIGATQGQPGKMAYDAGSAFDTGRLGDLSSTAASVSRLLSQRRGS